MDPGQSKTTSLPAFQGKSMEFLDRADGTRALVIYHPLDKSVPIQQIAVQPKDGKVFIFKVNKDEAVSQQFLDVVKLPESVDPSNVKANINKDSVLRLEATMIQGATFQPPWRQGSSGRQESGGTSF